MTQIGDTKLPGTQMNITSDRNFTVSDGAPKVAGLVGEADLANGTASADTVYKVSTPKQATDYFGDRSKSLLTQNVQDALQAGAYPVYAIAPSSTTVTGEDLSGMSSTSGDLTNAPVTDTSADTTFTIDGSTKNTIITLDDPHTKSPASGDVYLNHVKGTFELDAAPADTDTTNDHVDYTYYDYAGSITTLGNKKGEELDFMACLTEESASVTALKDEVLKLDNNFNFVLGIAGAGLNVTTSSYSNPFDTSRMQLLYPTRTDSGGSIIGAFVGLRASYSISRSVMKSRIRFTPTVRKTLTKSEKVDMDAANVVPVENRSPGVRFRSDPTCVSDTNTDEENMRDGLSRLIVDVVAKVVHDVSEDFIGKLHSQDARNSMRSMISNRLSALQQQNAVVAYTVTVTEQDSYTADVDVGVETVKPLRNVVADVTAGEVEE